MRFRQGASPSRVVKLKAPRSRGAFSEYGIRSDGRYFRPDVRRRFGRLAQEVGHEAGIVFRPGGDLDHRDADARLVQSRGRLGLTALPFR